MSSATVAAPLSQLAAAGPLCLICCCRQFDELRVCLMLRLEVAVNGGEQLLTLS